jgi:hypothetical protein
MSIIKNDMTPEQEKQALENWQPPIPHAIRFKRRVFELEQWIERERRFVEGEEVIARAMRLYSVDREQGRKYLTAVIEDFRRSNVPVLGS